MAFVDYKKNTLQWAFTSVLNSPSIEKPKTDTLKYIPENAVSIIKLLKE